MKKNLLQDLPMLILSSSMKPHNVRPNSDFFHVIQSLSKRWRNGWSPLILPITATPTDVTKELFGDSVFTFGIWEYLASGYAPNVEYHVITWVHWTAEEVKELVSMIRRAKEEQDFEIKEVLVKEARELFDVLIAQDVWIESFAWDIIDRLKEKKVDGTEEMKETIIFARSIHDADMIAREMNGKVWIQWFALAYHSQNDDNNALSRLTDPHNPCRVIVAVDKLNESIDLPVVRNIVFYRYTQDPKIYLQQFWRWLRGNGVVRYYDYIWWIENFSWIGQIQEKYSASIKVQGNNLWDPNTSFVIHTSLPWIENTIDEQEENPSQYPIMDMRDGDRITIEIEKPKAIFADHTIPINSEDIDPITPNAEKLPSVPTFYDTPINILDNVQNSWKRTENTEDPRVEKQNHFSGTSYFVNLADLGLMVHNLTCEVKEQLDVSDEDLRDFFLNISWVGKEGAYERWKESYTQLICYISFKKLKTMTVNWVPLRRIFLNKNIKSKRDLWTILMVYFSEYLELEKWYTQARYNNQKTMEKEQEKLNEEREKNQKEFIYALWLEIQKAIPDLESIKCANFEWVNTMNQWNTKQQATKKVWYEVDHLGKRVPTFMKEWIFIDSFIGLE
jgi:hypothetical protein